jgi:hypothetical protein
VALSFLYRLVRRVLGLLCVHRVDAAAKEVEILVLRHQLAVLPSSTGCRSACGIRLQRVGQRAER